MKLLILENTDQDRFGIDTAIMVVPEEYDSDTAEEESGLERPMIAFEIDFDLIWDEKLAPLVALGEYRAFIG